MKSYKKLLKEVGPTVVSVDFTTPANNNITADLTTDDNAALIEVAAQTAPAADGVLRSGAKKRKINQSSTTTTATGNVAAEKYCHCNKEGNAGAMVECTNGANCILFHFTKGWYHVSCVGLKNIRGIRNNNWLCPTCTSNGKKK